MSITLTQMLKQQRQLWLYGLKLSDLLPRGDLGLALDAEGPVGFVRVRGYRLDDVWHSLAQPLVLSLYGEGHPPDADDAHALPGERVWQATLDDATLRLDISAGTLQQWLGLGGAPKPG